MGRKDRIIRCYVIQFNSILHSMVGIAVLCSTANGDDL